MSIMLVPAVNANSLPTSNENVVSEKKALEHATVYMLQAVLVNTTGLEEWRGATINPEPLTLYDINGKKLFYEFSVDKNGNMVGRIKVSASPELGSSVQTFEIGPRRWNASTAIEKSKEIAQQQFNGKAEITSAKLVVYGYPNIGVMVTLVDQAGGKTRLFINALDYSIIPDKEPGADRIGVWSIYERLSEANKSKHIAEWNKDDKYVSFVNEKAKTMGIENLAQRTLSENELSSLKKQGIGITATSEKILNVPQYYQENSKGCCVASAQMIAAYYGVSHTQDHIASIMGCGVTVGCNPDQELVYYRGATPDGLGKTQSWSDSTPTWLENKNSINQDKPLRSATPTHCRVSRGWREYTNIFGTLKQDIYKNDPLWGTSWENWNDITHGDDLYVI